MRDHYFEKTPLFVFIFLFPLSFTKSFQQLSKHQEVHPKCRLFWNVLSKANYLPSDLHSRRVRTSSPYLLKVECQRLTISSDQCSFGWSKRSTRKSSMDQSENVVGQGDELLRAFCKACCETCGLIRGRRQVLSSRTTYFHSFWHAVEVG